MAVLARPVDQLREKFGDKVKENVPLAPYTSARIGGPADIFITADTVAELARVDSEHLWKNDMPFVMLGGGAEYPYRQR
ncbi:MAG: hypothetical protein U0V48_10100 [Anaerolineales bacterium]